MKALAIFATVAVAGVIVGTLRVIRLYDELDDGFDDIISHEYGVDPATWPRVIRNPR